ncbi:hypothetical protein ACFPRL_06005 [Pseudoclavibacter helvolus]
MACALVNASCVMGSMLRNSRCVRTQAMADQSPAAWRIRWAANPSPLWARTARS